MTERERLDKKRDLMKKIHNKKEEIEIFEQEWELKILSLQLKYMGEGNSPFISREMAERDMMK